MFVFIVSSPRSGSTVLGEILAKHPKITHWYEPYFIWDFYHGPGINDQRTKNSASKKSATFIRREFELYLKKSGKDILLEKTPINSFKIELINNLFPQAKFIHLIRDGRDVTRSIYREWQTRRNISISFNPLATLNSILTTLKRQPYWRNRLQAIWYEIRTQHRLSGFITRNNNTWSTNVGWGPRFPNWQSARNNLSLLEFCATQWYECESAIQAALEYVPASQVLNVHYEDLVSQPNETLGRIFQFVDQRSDKYLRISDQLDRKRMGQFEKYFDSNEKQKILAIIQPLLSKLGYN